MINEGGEGPGEGSHVEELEEGPAPGIGLALYDGDGGNALEGEDVEDHQAEADERGEDGGAVRTSLGMKGFDEGGGVFFGAFDVVSDGHGADEDLAGGKAGDHADANFPIVAEGGDDGLQRVACHARKAASKLGAWLIAIHFRVAHGKPEEDGEAEDHGASAAEENDGAVQHFAEDLAEGWHTVIWELHDEAGGGAAEECFLEEPSKEEGAYGSQDVKAEEKACLGERGGFVGRDKDGDHEQIHGQAGRAAHEGGHENRDQAVLG